MTITNRREKMDTFLAALRLKANVSLACEAAGLKRPVVYSWKRRYATFAREWEDALEDAVDLLAAEAWRRAMGEDSDKLLIFLLKAHRRGLYGDHVEVQSDNKVEVRYVDDWRNDGN